MSGIKVLEYKRFVKNALRGFVTIEMPSGVVFHGVSLLESNGHRWASPPSKAALGKDGSPILKNGKALYSPIVSFTSKELRDKFSGIVVDAVLSEHPDAFDAEGTQ